MEPLDLTRAGTAMVDYGVALPEFDYTSFFQDQEVNYLAAGSSSNSDSVLGAAFSSDASAPDAPSPSKKAASQKQKLERRGHTKSRRGCYNCKRRRVKCQETRPACGHCLKTGLQCEYPAVPLVTHQPQNQVPLFTLQDMRFFQYFLQTCFPRHPLGNDSVWTHEVPCLSQKYDYLMHAILGLSASELMLKEPDLAIFAMAHRLKAIKAIKRTLADVQKSNTFEEGNALMATCFALTFQSVLLDDGMAEFMTFCRGIIITAIQMWCKGAKFIFHDFIGEDQMAILKPLMEQLPTINSEWTDMAVASLQALEPLCKQPVEVEYIGLLRDIAQTLYTSSFEAYRILCRHYGWWMQISHQNFAHLIDADNATCTLLASHWIALKQIMAIVTEKEYEARAQAPEKEEKGMDVGMIRWLKHLNRQVPPDCQQYNQWPLWVEAQLDQDLAFFGRRQH